ncbi:MAG TPA: VWA domain-containing protein [Anaerolineae bacterium]|nr:VWA domain-containing protein [Anaerolineae bacterium]
MENTERTRRWRLILGGGEADGTGYTLGGGGGIGGIGGGDIGMDNALTALYNSDRSGGLGSSSPNVARWLGDIRSYFPQTVVQVMQKDALERLDLKQLLTEPEFLEHVTPDVHLAATLLSLKGAIPNKTKDTARVVVRKIVEELQKRLTEPLRQAVRGSLDRASRTTRPRHNEIDWNRTIRANLKNYQPEYQTIIPDKRIGYARRRGAALRHIVLCIDQSGSMATSVVYAGIFGAVLASIKAVSTRVVVFDTSVVDLTEEIDDPVELLFGTQLGGGTDINRALGYCQTVIDRPQDTILVLISDLYEGGNQHEMLRRAHALVDSGVQLIALLALSDDGAPSYSHSVAAAFAEMGVPSFACSPDQFPDLMAAAIQRQDLAMWAATNNVALAK